MFDIRVVGVQLAFRDKLVAGTVGLAIEVPYQDYGYGRALINFSETPQERAHLPNFHIHQLIVGVDMRVGDTNQILVVVLLVILVLHSVVPLRLGPLYTREHHDLGNIVLRLGKKYCY